MSCRDRWLPAYVPPSRFYSGGRSRWYYLVPRRLTLRGPGRVGIYRWIVWNFMLRPVAPEKETRA
jgi:hypothetical protein